MLTTERKIGCSAALCQQRTPESNEGFNPMQISSTEIPGSGWNDIRVSSHQPHAQPATGKDCLCSGSCNTQQLFDPTCWHECSINIHFILYLCTATTNWLKMLRKFEGLDTLTLFFACGKIHQDDINCFNWVHDCMTNRCLQLSCLFHTMVSHELQPLEQTRTAHKSVA